MVPPFSKPHIEVSPKRVRVLYSRQWIVDTKEAKLVRWEHQYYPTYFFEGNDVPQKYLRQSTTSVNDNENTKLYDVVVGENVAKAAAVKYGQTAGDLSGLIKIVFGAMSAWFEEDEEVFVHPKDPYKRVDVLQSSRHVRIEVNGVEIANTRKPRLLFETGLPVRTYIPKTDCRMDLLEPSNLSTECPYKGVASYYSIRLPDDGNHVFENIVWWYRTPLADCIDIKGFVAFYDEKVDVWVDGDKKERPHLPVS
ncbi:hypothetical protein EW145_g4087 [Phellinidium pouzarii]|uniref:DUF427 domain-containing protein n=1 Tax=Phellinidium pouzarii TaxID=167371 RepID=A0A4S4L502_9AGAM|nr:hypothetical protein EW145_g4087 [Phellinidium pouzarii]